MQDESESVQVFFTFAVKGACDGGISDKIKTPA